jgi:uncharacterized protein YceH (UPF0502 family)
MRVFGMTSAEVRVLGCLLEKRHSEPAESRSSIGIPPLSRL